MKKMFGLLVGLAFSAGLIDLSAQEEVKVSHKRGSEESVEDKAKAASEKRASRGGHYIPPRERHLNELIAKIRTAEEAGKTYQGPHRMSEEEREKARNNRLKVEGGANFRDGVSGAESEYGIGVDPTGQNIVVGYNLFAQDPAGLSGMGVAYSTDGGQTFQDAGFLPSPGNQSDTSGNVYPQILSDPDIKWVPGGSGCNFIASSIIAVAFPATGRATGSADTVGIHRSTDCGATWSGPFEVTPATNPNGLTSSGSAYDGSDKEFMDVNLETGRVMVSWSSFTATRYNVDGVELSVTYSDNIMTGNPPVWSKRSVLNSSGTGFATGSVPRFGPSGTQDAYVAYSLGTDQYLTRNVQVAASHDGGSTWGTPVYTAATNFAGMDDVLGNDRVNEFPSMAVDTSSSPYRGNVYIVYSNNDSNDGADVAFQSSSDRGASWSKVKLINARPGQDRAQWFPYVTVDKNTGRVAVIFYDQSFNTSGDLTQVLMTFSDDGGVTWAAPVPLTPRPFHAAYGNDSSAPNLGDYIAASSQNGTLYAVWAGTPNSVSFSDGQPGFAFSVPTLFFKTYTGPASPAVDLGTITVSGTSTDGFIHPGDTADVSVALRNPITNPGTSPATLTGVTAILSTTTPGANVVTSSTTYPDLAPSAAAINSNTFKVALTSDFVAGTPVEFALDITTANGVSRRLFTQNTGAPQGTVLFSEDFESVSAGSLPNGWLATHGAGSNTVPWTSNKSFCNASSNGLFHIDAEDGRSVSNASRWERAISPIFNVPADAQWVTVDMDICYDTEDDVSYPTIAYDGAFLRITDQTGGGRSVRSVVADGFAETLTTGTLLGYPKHLSDNRIATYFGDTSGWAGDSGGMKHVTMRLPGMAGSAAQLRFEYTQDQFGTCKDVRPDRTVCGVLIDNIVVRSVKSN